MINHCAGIENKAADALSQLTVTLHHMNAHVIRFDRLKDKYSTIMSYSFFFLSKQLCYTL